MGKCQVKKGIFVLSTCDSPASIQCDECLIFICGNHSQQSGPKVLCPECFVKAHPENFGQKTGQKTQRLEDDYYRNYNSWYFGTRNRFYSMHHYSPFLYDDYRSFDSKQDTEFQDDNESGSFFDS